MARIGWRSYSLFWLLLGFFLFGVLVCSRSENKVSTLVNLASDCYGAWPDRAGSGRCYGPQMLVFILGLLSIVYTGESVFLCETNVSKNTDLDIIIAAGIKSSCRFGTGANFDDRFWRANLTKKAEFYPGRLLVDRPSQQLA